ncbi:DUF305 domain-containing protein [Cellulomonas endophytica]|uniref:DUF305 domain-containing protein n=1 Tax=Cellulomonas endophytica TaxID=2494735 RepID=UPI001012372B|nr:DUF305 domain-containing protein [Cellulomonas endophytica]
MSRIPARRPLATAAAVLLAAGLATGVAGCASGGGGGTDAGAGDGATAGAGAEHSDADVAFAQMMVEHHEGALEMAGDAAERAQDAEVRALAERIAAAQGPEIALMTGWLEDWGAGAGGDMHHGDHGGTADMEMDGMTQADAMEHLDGLSGAAYDRAFLELMTAHHEGAVAMAGREQEEGAAAEAVALAGRIVADQTAEIDEMEGLLGRLP